MFSAAAVAFLVAALLILLVFRLAFGRRLRAAGGRSRQPRLGIVDVFDVDPKRQLVIVRRDNTEHLVMIGGPNDILIESSIVRAEAAREAQRRDKESEPKLSLEEAIGAALAVSPSPPTAPPAPAPNGQPTVAPPLPRAPVLPLPSRRPPPQPPVGAGPAPHVPPAAGPPSVAAPAVSPPTVSAPSVVGPLRRPILGGSLDPASTPRPPLLRVPPLRPAPRTTPVAPPSPPPPPPPAADLAAAPPPPGPVPEPMPEAASAPPPAEPVPEPKPAGPADTFESLEEEMAKLLGRGGPGSA